MIPIKSTNPIPPITSVIEGFANSETIQYTLGQGAHGLFPNIFIRAAGSEISLVIFENPVNMLIKKSEPAVNIAST